MKRAPSEKKELAGNRQLAPRFRVKLPLSISVVENDAWSGEEKLSPRVEGYTRDISRIGVAIVVPEFEHFGHDFAETDRRLLITVNLPTSTVDLRVAPVRREQLNPQKGTVGCLIGTRIIKMTDRDCSFWLAYLDSIAPRNNNSDLRF